MPKEEGRDQRRERRAAATSQRRWQQRVYLQSIELTYTCECSKDNRPVGYQVYRHLLGPLNNYVEKAGADIVAFYKAAGAS